MIQPSRRCLLGLLLLALALTACGRSSPNVTAEDGRGLERPSGGIWIPETREVDPGTDMRRGDEESTDPSDEDEEEDEESSTRGERRDRAAAASVDEESTTGTAQDTAPATGSRDERSAAPTQTKTRTSTGNGRRTDADPGRTEPEQDDRDDEEPAEPEVVGDCGAEASGPTPSQSELEAAVAELREELRARWPETQAGAWTVSEPTEVHVGFTRAVASRLGELCASFPYPQLLHGARTELSELELTDLLDEVVEDRDALRDGETREDLPSAIRATRGIYAAAVDHAGNGLRITVEEPGDELLEAFRGHYTPRLRLVEGEFDGDGELVTEDGTRDG